MGLPAVQPWAALQDLLDAAPLPAPARSAAMDAYLGPGRHYHGARHIALMWGLHRAVRAADPAEDRKLAAAVLAHDVVYDAQRSDNEELSARWLLAAGGTMTPEERDWTARAIRASADHLAAGPAGPDGLTAWFLGLDLSPLAAVPDEFDRNTGLIRLEFGHVPDTAWRTGRGAFLQRMLDAPVLYADPVLRGLLDAAARANLRRAVAALAGPG